MKCAGQTQWSHVHPITSRHNNIVYCKGIHLICCAGNLMHGVRWMFWFTLTGFALQTATTKSITNIVKMRRKGEINLCSALFHRAWNVLNKPVTWENKCILVEQTFLQISNAESVWPTFHVGHRERSMTVRRPSIRDTKTTAANGRQRANVGWFNQCPSRIHTTAAWPRIARRYAAKFVSYLVRQREASVVHCKQQTVV